uniref:Phospholipase A2 n=1 Tax=Leptobrachium leishanense TaxID=445787 RepID=A0A8C5MPQ2_9ANUR
MLSKQWRCCGGDAAGATAMLCEPWRCCVSRGDADTSFLAPQEEASNFELSIRVIEATTKPDCYACLWIPTTLQEKKRTRTIWNNRNPVWDESFHFRIHSQIKNILELSLHDEDIGTKDDHLYTVSYDLANVTPDEPLLKTFYLNSEVRRPPCLILCSFEDTQRMVFTPSDTNRTNAKEDFVFHYPRDWGSELTASLSRVYPPLDVTFVSISAKAEGMVSTYIRNTMMLGSARTCSCWYLIVNVCLHSPEKLDVRLGFDLCDQEKVFLRKRQKVVAAGLKKILQLNEEVSGDDVPVVAVMATGGGARAMSSLYSHLCGLQEMGLLDCITYIAGASGSTWTMSKMYEDPAWSQSKISESINSAKKHVTKKKTSVFSMDRLKYYRKELQESSKEGQKASFTDLWGLMIESMFHTGSKLSDEKAALENGQNPLPIYLAMNVKQGKISTLDFKEWCEFTPYEVSLLKYGASIKTEDFGSEFYMGRLMKRHPEPRICYLQGKSLVLFVYKNFNFDGIPVFFFINKDMENLQSRRESAHIKTQLYTPSNTFSKILTGVLTSRPIDGEQQNFLRGFHLHKDYHQHSQFRLWKDTHLDTFPNKLTPLADNLCLVDAGYFINASFPPLLRPERKVDIILSFDYTLDTPLQSVEQTCTYCTAQGIGFPKVHLSDEDKKKHKECYVFTDDNDPGSPIVLHFPLVNDSFRKYKEPGILRSPEEESEGDVDVTSFFSPYFLTNFTYSESDFDRLMKLTQYNLLNNKGLIMEALRTAMQRRKAKNLVLGKHQVQTKG